MATNLYDSYVEIDFESVEFDEDSHAPPVPDIEEEPPASWDDIASTICQDESAKSDSRRAHDDDEEPTISNRFTRDDAITKATNYVTSVLDGLPSDPVYTMPVPNAKLCLALVAALVPFRTDARFKDFCTYVLTKLWHIVTVGDGNTFTYREILIRHFHQFRISDELRNTWDVLLDSFHIARDRARAFILQRIVDTVREQLVKDRNTVDLAVLKSEINACRLNKKEEQVLSYVAGYIPSVLRKHYRKARIQDEDNKAAYKIDAVFHSWLTAYTDAGQFSTFRQYAQNWMEAKTNGKVFQPKPELFLFFRALEIETRVQLNTAFIGSSGEFRKLLIGKLSTKYMVQKYWSGIEEVNWLESEQSMHLFYIMVKYFVNIRIKQFVDVFADMKDTP